MLAILIWQASYKKEQAMSDNENPKSKGGNARARVLTDEQKSEIAKSGAIARWGNEMPEALYSGVLKLGTVELPCYVTVDGERLVSGRGMQEALRLVDEELPESGQKPGSRMTRLLNNIKLKPLIFKNKSQDHFLPKKIRFQGKIINGYNGEMLADICDGMLEARAQNLKLTARQEIVAAQCEMLMRAFARVGIAALIDEASGYQNVRPIDALKAYLDTILLKDLAAWVKRFPDEYYENIYKLKGWDWPGMSKNRYSVVGKYTNDLIYERLAPGLKDELDKRNPKDTKGKRKVKNHQWFDEGGEKLYAQQMFTVITIQRACLKKPGDKWALFKSMMDDLLPKKGDTLPLGF
jgi:hypothetical protein